MGMSHELPRRTVLQLAGALAGATPARAEAGTIRMGIQYGVTYLPFAVAQHERTIERRAKEAGLGDVSVQWSRVAGGNLLNDALLAGQLDCAATGYPSFFILWSKTRGRQAIKGLTAYGNTPLFLLTRNPAVKGIADFTEADRITVPAVKSSVQAILLQMAAEKIWNQWDRLDPITIWRGHPDAIAALMSMSGEINSAFSAPPYQYVALERPGIHLVTTAEDIFGGPCSNGILYMTESFHDQNQGAARAINAGLQDALALINQDPRRASEMYLEVTGEKQPLDLVLRTATAPGTKWEAAPHGVMRFAEFMRRTGALSKAPTSWKDVFFPEAHDLAGD